MQNGENCILDIFLVLRKIFYKIIIVFIVKYNVDCD